MIWDPIVPNNDIFRLIHDSSVSLLTGIQFAGKWVPGSPGMESWSRQSKATCLHSMTQCSIKIKPSIYVHVFMKVEWRLLHLLWYPNQYSLSYQYRQIIVCQFVLKISNSTDMSQRICNYPFLKFGFG